MTYLLPEGQLVVSPPFSLAAGEEQRVDLALPTRQKRSKKRYVILRYTFTVRTRKGKIRKRGLLKIPWHA